MNTGTGGDYFPAEDKGRLVDTSLPLSKWKEDVSECQFSHLHRIPGGTVKWGTEEVERGHSLGTVPHCTKPFFFHKCKHCPLCFWLSGWQHLSFTSQNAVATCLPGSSSLLSSFLTSLSLFSYNEGSLHMTALSHSNRSSSEMPLNSCSCSSSSCACTHERESSH